MAGDGAGKRCGRGEESGLSLRVAPGDSFPEGRWAERRVAEPLQSFIAQRESLPTGPRLFIRFTFKSIIAWIKEEERSPENCKNDCFIQNWI